MLSNPKSHRYQSSKSHFLLAETKMLKRWGAKWSVLKILKKSHNLFWKAWIFLCFVKYFINTFFKDLLPFLFSIIPEIYLFVSIFLVWLPFYYLTYCYTTYFYLAISTVSQILTFPLSPQLSWRKEEENCNFLFLSLIPMGVQPYL